MPKLHLIIPMKKLIITVFISMLPALVFSQGVDKAHIGFMAGISSPFLPSDFKDTYSTGFDFNFSGEHDFGKLITLGGEIKYNYYKLKYDYGINNEIHPSPFGIFSFAAFIKAQNNSAALKSFQPFFKIGLGYFTTTDKKKIPRTSAGVLGSEGAVFSFSPGINYILPDGNKITSSVEYKINNGIENAFSSVQIDLGLSFLLK